MKTRKLLLTALSMMLVATSAFAFASCDQMKGAKGDKGDKGDKGVAGIAGENGIGVEGVEYDENGDLKITYTDGTSETVGMPSEDNHTYGDWTAYFPGEAYCGDGLYYRVCGDCNDVEWKQDQVHNWSVTTQEATCTTEGLETKTCITCGEQVETVLPMGHNLDETGVCKTCEKQVGYTEGLVFEIQEDVNGKYAVVKKYNGTAEEVVIPEIYEEVPVTVIGIAAFDAVVADGGRLELKTLLTKVTMPDTITEIGTNAFTQCQALQEINISKNLKKLGGWAFKDCISLKAVDLPEGLLEIGDSAFRNMTVLRGEFKIPSTVTTIGAEIFYNTDGVTKVIFPDTVTSLGTGIFRNADGIKEVKFPEGLKELGNNMFGGATGIEEIVIPDSVQKIGDQFFYKCNALKNIYFGKNLNTLGGYIFYKCSAASTVNIHYPGTEKDWDDFMLIDDGEKEGEKNDAAAIKARVIFNSAYVAPQA
ncbi:MAG: leucine-rich repeat protein [Clostridia bacterium]|nr:leucine-rich repeat protein [Clostridia bacterium]